MKRADVRIANGRVSGCGRPDVICEERREGEEWGRGRGARGWASLWKDLPLATPPLEAMCGLQSPLPCPLWEGKENREKSGGSHVGLGWGRKRVGEETDNVRGVVGSHLIAGNTWSCVYVCECVCMC
eukprot:Sspe_Gene.115376::Locus_102613_Transcript_1_1_Confidence_1.000_Length_461::g.115376::m.115376